MTTRSGKVSGADIAYWRRRVFGFLVAITRVVRIVRAVFHMRCSSSVSVPYRS
ncbi:hypothetical protein BJX96DRAFT_144181 [Aspergillus floccosus]